MTRTPLALVAAVARNGVIGEAGRTPWRLPSDLARFRAITMGKPLLMGRKTFEAIGRALPGRETIVVTRDRDFASSAGISGATGVHVAHELEIALALSQERAAAMEAEEIIIAGGGELYAAMIGRVARMRLTFVDLAPEGRVRFPKIGWSEWIEERRIAPEPKPGDEATFVFADFRRRD